MPVIGKAERKMKSNILEMPGGVDQEKNYMHRAIMENKSSFSRFRHAAIIRKSLLTLGRIKSVHRQLRILVLVNLDVNNQYFIYNRIII